MRLLQKAGRGLASLLTALFGSLSYRPPPFAKFLGKKTAVGFHRVRKAIANYRKDKPIRFKWILGLTLLSAGIITGGVIWYQSLPQPAYLAVTVSEPGLTPLKKDAVPDKISVRFAGSAARLKDVDKKITGGIRIVPEMAGAFQWVKDNQIVFTPAEEWAVDQTFKIKFEKRLFANHVQLEDYEVSFKTKPFDLSIPSSQFYIDPRDENIKQVTATIHFTHPVDPKTFESQISLTPKKLGKEERSFEDRAYAVKVTYDDYFGQAYLMSEALAIPDEEVVMTLNINKGVQSSLRGKPTTQLKSVDILVPGITSYVNIHSVTQEIIRNDDYKMEQVLVIHSKGKASVNDLINNLEIWKLPRDRPASPGIKFRKSHRWRDASKIGPKVLEKSQKVNLNPIPAEHTYSEINSFKIKLPPGSYIYVKLKAGTPFYGKYILSKDHEVIQKIKKFPTQVEIMHEGMLLSSSGDKKLSIITQGVKGLQFEVGRVLQDQVNHLVTQTNGNLANMRFKNNYFNKDNIVENFTDTLSLLQTPPDEPNFTSFSLAKYLKDTATGASKKGIFLFKVREWDPETHRPGSKSDQRLILVSDIGVLAKDAADKSHELFIQSVSTGRPVSGAKIQVLGKNGIPVLTSYSDYDGRVKFGALKDFQREKAPVAYLITKNTNISFLPVNAPGRWLNYSRFDVSGAHGHVNPKKINAYLFSDRGIYRPADTLHVGMIVKTTDWQYSLSGAPFEVVIVDSRGLEIYNRKFKLGESGFEELAYSTEISSPTGTYQVNLYTVKNKKRYRSVGRIAVKVEEFLPDRLTIKTKFSRQQKKGWISPDGLISEVVLKNLFGSPAAGNRVTARLTLSPGNLYFPKYDSYQFTPSQKSGKHYTETLDEQVTDKQGMAKFDLQLERFKDATYRITFNANGYEKEGGRFVSAYNNVMVSPLDYLIGVKANGSLNYIRKSSRLKLDVIAINSDLNQIEAKNITFQLSRIEYVSTLTKRNNGTYGYKSIPKTLPVSSEVKTIPAKGFGYFLPTDTAGNYQLELKNKTGAVLSKTKFTVIGKENLSRNLDKTAELKIKLNKNEFDPGEDIEVFIQAPYTGAGLITIERDRVYAYKWFYSRENSFTQKIKLPESMEGNGYINVSFLRAADSKEIFMSPHSYGVHPFTIDRERRVNKLKITVPEKARSGKRFPIKYRSEKPGKIIVYAVDEGILQVANYQTPDPLGYFFKKRALEVRTAQILDLVLPDYSVLKSLSAPGGGAGSDELAKNLNPFQRKRSKPVAFWSGILETTDKEQTLNYTVPEYFNGTLRVMAVAVSDDAIGRFEEKSVVRNPFIISPNLPLFAAPGDVFTATTTITNMQEGSGKPLPITLDITSSKSLVVDNKQIHFRLEENADTTLSLDVTVQNQLGDAFLKMKVSGGKESATLASHLSVRPAIPHRTSLKMGVLKKKKLDVITDRKMYPNFRVLEFSASYLPLGLSKGLLRYLDAYPYGCTEQILSRSFPYLYLSPESGLGIDPAQREKKLNHAIKVLSSRQNAKGKFGIWAANSFTSDFITVYGAHFITECKRFNVPVPQPLTDRTLKALRNILKEGSTEMHKLRVKAYAAYILTRHQVVTTQYLTQIVMALKANHEDWQEDITAAYIAASYMLLKKENEARTLIRKTAQGRLQNLGKWDYFSEQIGYSQLLYLLAMHFPEDLVRYATGSLNKLTGKLAENHYNTVSSSFAIMGFAEYAKATGEVQSGQFTLKQHLSGKKEEVLLLPEGKFPTVTFSADTEKLTLSSKEKIPIYYQVTEAGFDSQLPVEKVSRGLEVYREFTDKEGNPLTETKLGEDVRVHLKFRSLSENTLHNMALVDLLPAGLEPVTTSVRAHTAVHWRPEYIDVREDRLVLYGSISDKLQQFTYTARVVNKGKYTVPPLYAESMYDNTLYALTPQNALVVK